MPRNGWARPWRHFAGLSEKSAQAERIQHYWTASASTITERPRHLNQVASISVEDARTPVLSPWEKPLLPEIEKAILRSDIGITPIGSGDVVRVPLPPLTEENRRDLAKQARAEAEASRVSIRNIRRDAIADIRDLVKENWRQKTTLVVVKTGLKR